MSAQVTYIELSDDLRRLLASKKIDLQAELQQQGINTELHGLSLAGRPQVREPFLIILAAGVTASLVGGAISRVIAAVSGYRRAQMTERELHIARDAKGDAIIDNSGDPVYNLVERPGLLPPAEVTDTRLVAGKVLSFGISTGERSRKTVREGRQKPVAKGSVTSKRSAKNVRRRKRAK